MSAAVKPSASLAGQHASARGTQRRQAVPRVSGDIRANPRMSTLTPEAIDTSETLIRRLGGVHIEADLERLATIGEFVQPLFSTSPRRDTSRPGASARQLIRKRRPSRIVVIGNQRLVGLIHV